MSLLALLCSASSAHAGLIWGVIPTSAATDAAIAAAGPASISCTTNPRQPHYRLIYSRPYDVADRQGTIIPQLRTETYRASAVLEQLARVNAPGVTRKLPIWCSGGIPTVDVVRLDSTNATETRDTIRTELRSRGYNSPAPALTRYLVYHDSIVGDGPGQPPAGTGGQAEFPGGGSSPDPFAGANSPDRYAQTYYHVDAGPYWYLMLHEALHTMGAVQSDSPNSNGGGHCVVDWDVMCYDSNGSGTTLVCSTLALDCGASSYFHAGTPTPGSYLATHWNLGSPKNQWIDAGAQRQDFTTPSQPAGLAIGAVTHSTIELSWGAAIDDTGVTAYRVEISATSPSSGFTTVGTGAGTSRTLTGILPGVQRWLRVVALDAAGNASTASSSIMATTTPDNAAPSTPAGFTSDGTTATSIDVSWGASTDNDAVDAYLVERVNGVNYTVIATTTQDMRSASLTSLAPSTPYILTVRSRDRAGNLSPRSNAITVTTQASTTPPPTPVIVGTSIIASSVTINWGQDFDPAGIAFWTVQISDAWQIHYTGNHTQQVAQLPLALPADRSYTILVRATNNAGISSDWGSATATPLPPAPQPPVWTPPVVQPKPQPPVVQPKPPVTKKDTKKPTRPGRPRVTRSTRSTLRVTWKASRDNVRVTRYRVYVAVGKRGKFKLKRTQLGRTYTIRKLRRNTTYRIRIRAYDKAGNASSWSAIRTAKTKR